VVVIGPVFAIGMVGAGNTDDISAFMTLVTDVRDRAERSFFMLLVHHENKAGDVSGAWGPRPDVLVLVQVTEPKHVRMLIRKAKWASELHGQARFLKWADGETFEVVNAPGKATEDEVWEDVAGFVLTHGGTSWGPVDKAVRGDDHTKRRVRDRMIELGALVNLGNKRKDGSWNFKLWHPDDETAPLEVQWVATGLATGLAGNSDSGTDRQSPVVRWSRSTGPPVPDLDPSSELADEPPDDPDEDIPF
jgi:hypothetical protein